MKVVIVYARLYASCLSRAAKGLGKNPWTILLPMALFFAFVVLAMFAAQIPLIGGFLIPLVGAAIGSAYLYFVGEIVGRSRVRVNELWKAVRAYFWSLINLSFWVWIAGLLLGSLVSHSPNAGLLLTLFGLAVFIVLNAAPEVIYQEGTYGGLATLQRSVEFIQQSWIEWFIPMGLLYAAYKFLWVKGLQPLIFQAVGAGMIRTVHGLNPSPQATSYGALGFWMLAYLLSAIVFGAILHYVMLFRGFLFLELKGSSHRQRMFKYRNATDAR